MLKNVRYYKTKITKYVHKVCFISIQNTVNEKFLAKHFLQHQFFLNIISTFTLATLSLPVLHLIKANVPLIQKPVHWVFRENQWNGFCLKELILNELSSEKYFSKLKQFKVKLHWELNFYINVR